MLSNKYIFCLLSAVKFYAYETCQLDESVLTSRTRQYMPLGYVERKPEIALVGVILYGVTGKSGVP
jgi:hypothetical protein